MAVGRELHVKTGTAGGRPFLLHVFEGRILGGQPSPRDPDGLVQEAAWFAAAEIAALRFAFPEDRSWLLDYLRAGGDQGGQLVRDRIPELAAGQGRPGRFRAAPRQDLPGLLLAKVREEADEVVASGGSPEAVADLPEVLSALAEARGLSPDDLGRVRADRRRARGGFSRGYLLLSPAAGGAGEPAGPAKSTGGDCGQRTGAAAVADLVARRLVFTAPRQAEVEEVRLPAPGPGQALVRGEWSLISTGTEMTAYTGDFPRENSAWAAYVRYPFRSGYSSVGVVEVVGEGCALESGQRIVSAAGHASRFLVNAPAAGAGPSLAGRHPAADAMPVPAGIGSEEAAFHTIARIVLNGVRLSRVEFGEAAAVVGCGLLGQLAMRFLRLAGALPVVAVDLSRERLAQAQASGADALVCPADGDAVPALRAANAGRLADLVIDVTGAPDSFPLATRLARDLGRVVVLGSPRGPVTVDLHDDVHTRGLQVIGAHASTTPRQETPHTPWSLRRNVEYFFALLGARRLEVADLVSHRFPLSRAADAFAMLDRDRTQAMGVLLQLDA